MSEIYGECLCGAVRLRTANPAPAVAVCHCDVCQKQAGSAFSTVAIFAANDIQISGELQEYVSRNDAGEPVRRRFCPRCGTPVATSSAGSEAQGIVVVKLPLFSAMKSEKPQMQMFCEHALAWMPDIPGTQRFARMPG
jgi:hypothetical protein